MFAYFPRLLNGGTDQIRQGEKIHCPVACLRKSKETTSYEMNLWRKIAANSTQGLNHRRLVCKYLQYGNNAYGIGSCHKPNKFLIQWCFCPSNNHIFAPQQIIKANNFFHTEVSSLVEIRCYVLCIRSAHIRIDEGAEVHRFWHTMLFAHFG